MTLPSVSAIVPIHNGASFLSAAVASILDQRHAPLELILVDDGSTDGSGRIMAETKGAVCIRQPNPGVAAARNAGLARATGDFIAFLDQDDEWLPWPSDFSPR
jgi:glycosyltransferase involved in cell wall biosynthesis